MKIDVNHITMIYPSGKKALQDVSIRAESPSFIGILGPNGAGKTTLMKLLIAGLLPTKGEILLDEKPLLSQEKYLKSQLGYLPQSFGLYEELTVWQFLDYMAALKNVKDKTTIDKVLELTSMTEQKRVRIRNLSGGQRQRVGIAQALLGDPQLIILDEPTVGLDPEERVKFRNIFSEMAQDKIILLSTHIVEDVQAVCNRVLVIHSGKVLFDGLPSKLIEQSEKHTGVYISQPNASAPEGCQIVSKIHTAEGIRCRVVAEQLPAYAQPVEPSLEDAYLYCIHKDISKKGDV
ncbi:MAG: ATP-binding cassette domain-containing protein [Lachnospiraceae bacterium]|nr:ATP-binding cassette domain-containing protein [Lachnospiraceae bacterium]